jgi:hypothetical protein
MAKKPEQFLVETSALRPALGDSTPRQCGHFREEVGGGRLFTSAYIRMEFLRRWVCDAIRLAVLIGQSSAVADALTVIEQEFRPRKLKSTLAVLGKFLREAGTLPNSRAVALEVGRLAVRWVQTFDEVFPTRVANRSRCRIGAMTPQVDFNCLLEDLVSFRDAFLTPITDCEVNAFLGFGTGRGRAAALLEDAGVAGLPVGERLRVLDESQTWITCRECATIGDVIIALEQPAACCLVHVDTAFHDLCRATGRRHKGIKSVAAAEREHRPRADR